jgi:DNA mismatch repair protein MutL
MSKIALLSDLVINQIAAGEVLENPASAVKELLENSIDAGATEIRIDIEGGGLLKIRIEDDGCGMSREDAILSLERHATSKIRALSDLDQLMTMGFRGEALAALSSVSELEIRTSDGNEAVRVGSVIEPIARNQGTTIEARNLFYNAPARLKFQKSPSACAAAVLKTVQSVALGHPEIQFRLFSNGKPTLEVMASDWKTRAREVLGDFPHEITGTFIRGLVGYPEEGRLNRSGQMVYVNRRPIYSPLIAKAVKEGFGTRMQASLYPVFILYLDIAPDLVDVNVHPQKREVRFREEAKIYTMVRDAVAAAFKTQSIPEVTPLPWEFVHVPQSQAPLPFVMEDAPPSLPMETRGKALFLLGEFLVVEASGWLLVDLKGAEARILFDEMEKGKPTSSSQPLMWPIEIQTSNPEEVAENVKPLYIEARPVGKNRLLIDAIPSSMDVSQIEELITLYQKDRKLAAAITRVCRGAIKRYTLDQAAAIWRKLQDSQYDPLGKKIVAEMKDLKRWFE